MQSDNFTDELQARGATQPTPVIASTTSTPRSAARSCKDKLWYYMSVRQQGQRQNTLNVYYNQNAGDPNAWQLRTRISTGRRFRIARGRTTRPRITWQATPRNKFTGSWDEQPVCRSCSGTTSLTGSPNFIFPTSPEADGHGEFSPQRVQQVRWSSPRTDKLLLEAGMGTTYYQWGGRELDPNPTRNLVQVLNLTTDDRAGPACTPMVYRSQSWLNNRTRGTTWNASASYMTGSHSMKFGYQGNYWSDDREINVNDQGLRYTFFGPDSPLVDHPVRQRLQRERARDAGVAVRAGSVDAQAADAAGRAALGPSLELVPGNGRTGQPVLPWGDLRRAPTASPATTTSRHASVRRMTCSATARRR